MTTAHDYAAKHHDRFLEQLKTLIRIPSVSTQPEHAAAVRLSSRRSQRAAEWLANDMRQIGLETAEVIKMPSGRHPLVLGAWAGAGEESPTVLIYLTGSTSNSRYIAAIAN
jgi:acetylornithine deacetylase/succinyl-diaminopimelate desuccinylase-like protein